MLWGAGVGVGACVSACACMHLHLYPSVSFPLHSLGLAGFQKELWQAAACALSQAHCGAGQAEGVESTDLDALITNWNHTNIRDMDFGTGPVRHPTGHFGIQRTREVCAWT